MHSNIYIYVWCVGFMFMAPHHRLHRPGRIRPWPVRSLDSMTCCCDMMVISSISSCLARLARFALSSDAGSVFRSGIRNLEEEMQSSDSPRHGTAE